MNITRRWKATIVALTAAATVGLTGCAANSGRALPAETPVAGGVLEYGTDVQPTAGGLDPFLASSFAAQNVLVQVYESLLTRGDDGTYQPGLAESWEQTSPVSYRFTLRPDAKFSDGSPVTSEDVVFSFNQMRGTTAPQRTMLGTLTDVVALGPLDIQFTLKAPSGTFMNVVSARSSGLIASKKWYESTPPEVRQRTAMGSGPFQLTNWQDQVVISLTRNPHYWDAPRPYLDGINFRIVPDAQARMALLRQGTVDAIWLADPQLGEQAESEGFLMGANAETRALTMLVDSTTGPMANPLVRQALSKALNREQIANLATYGYGKPSLTVPVGDPAAVAPDANTPNYTYDPDGARALLAEAGVENLTIGLTYAGDAAFSQDTSTYEVMQEQLSRVGINLDLRPLPWADVMQRVVGGTYSDLIAVPMPASADPAMSFAFFLSPGIPSNKTGASGADATKLFGKLMAVADPQARRAVLAELETEVADQVLVLTPYAVTLRQEIWSPHLAGYSPDTYSFRYRLAESWMES
jgi:peptide/nickel transport system substrate-binding protein